jgi:hypothetical protein
MTGLEGMAAGLAALAGFVVAFFGLLSVFIGIEKVDYLSSGVSWITESVAAVFKLLVIVVILFAALWLGGALCELVSTLLSVDSTVIPRSYLAAHTLGFIAFGVWKKRRYSN